MTNKIINIPFKEESIIEGEVWFWTTGEDSEPVRELEEEDYFRPVPKGLRVYWDPTLRVVRGMNGSPGALVMAFPADEDPTDDVPIPFTTSAVAFSSTEDIDSLVESLLEIKSKHQEE